MSVLPHDIADLYFAPVALAIDARIAELGSLEPAELQRSVAIAGDRTDWTAEFREEALLIAIRQVVNTHGWTLGWEPRGVRLTHGRRSVVLGVPQRLRDFVAGSGASMADA